MARHSTHATPDRCAAGLPRWTRITLAAILIAYLVLATLQSYATRLQWGPDEPAHIIYVRSLGMDLRLPALTHSEDDDAYVPGAARTHQAHHPPLYYALAGLVWRASAGLPAQRVDIRDPHTGTVVAHTVPGAVRAVRFLSMAFGFVALLFVWAAARVVFPDRPDIGLGGVALLAFTPMFTYLSGVINNDSLLALWCAAIIHRWARLLRFGASSRDVVVLGLLLGLALNTKETALGFLACSFLVLALAPGADSGRSRLRNGLLILALSLALAGWWTVRKLVLYGQPLVYPFDAPMLSLPPEQRAMYLYALPAQIFLFAFIPLDVVDRHMSLPLIVAIFGGLAVLALGGLAATLLRRRRLHLPSYESQSLWLWLAVGVVVLAGIVRNVLYIDWRMGPAGGRYLVAALPGLSLAATRGLSALFGDGRLARLALLLAALAVLAMNVCTIRATGAEYGTLWY